MPRCLICGGKVAGTPTPALRRGHTVVVLVTVSEGLTFEQDGDEQEYADRERTTEITEELMMVDGWEKGYVAQECLVGV